MKNKFFISTAVDYVNSSPHIGHALEKIQADVTARYHRLLGEEVFFLTGTDENSLKNVQAAEKEKTTTKELVNKNAKKFRELKKALNLSFNDFIRTTEKRHIDGAQKLWLACKKDIYKKNYKGLYCVGCEEFYKENELKNGFCPVHKTKLEIVEEENYFFRLSKYQNDLKKLIEKDKVNIIPKSRKNELLSFINSGLYDFCISRLAKRGRGWGIPVPGDPDQVLWTWFDALSNYINALDYAKNSERFQKFWQENNNKLHVIGKGIIRFHGVYWIAMLLSAKLSLPSKIFVHGFIGIDGQKMSKSLGNVVDPFELVKKYGTDAVRYYLLREIPSAEDGDFTYEKFEQRYNADLASGIGNLVARVRTMTEKTGFKPGKIKEVEPKIREAQIKYKKVLDKFKFNKALEAIWELISFSDKYIEEKKPWEDKEDSPQVLDNLLIVLDNIAELLEPFLPETSEKIKKEIKRKEDKFINPKSSSLFPRL